MIDDEGRLNQLVLTIFIEEQIDNIAPLMMRFVLNMMFIRHFTCIFQCLDLIEIHTGVFADGIDHRHLRKRLAEIDHLIAIGDNGRAVHLLRDIAVHTLCQFHHAVVVGVCLIEFHQSELRIVLCIDSLVAEYTADLKYALESADNEALEIKLQRNTESDVLIQGIVMCLKWLRRRTAGIVHQHRCLDLHEIAACEEAADLTDNL